MRRSVGRTIFRLFILLALYISVLISARNYTTIFIAFLTLGWHTIANVFCASISSYRFKNPAVKYVEIKNKFIKKIFLRPFYVGERYSICKHDNKTNIIGLVLNIINIVLVVSFEILLFLPKIPCDPYIFSLGLPTRRHHFKWLYLELNSFNEIIPAETSQLFAFVTGLIFFVFFAFFEHQLNKEERQKNKSPQKSLKKTEWYYPLYTSLVNIAVRKNNKKLKFWYDKDQLEQIENLVKSVSENAEVKLETKGNKLVSFKVVDTLNSRVTFTGLFM